ncbi:MAG: hypothetical protein JJ974_07930 [Phycisphaerales bacterium]|nr:hypothetical protein [Phycisphaerales bacterium]
MKFASKSLGVIALMMAAGTNASGQVVINEVYENPPGSGSSNDAVLEYIELYGTPGMDLTGYCIGQLKGGEDDGDDIPEEASEIDEAFSLDGLTIGSNGFLVIYNGTAAQSLIPLFLPNEGENSASFFDTHIPTTDSNGNLNNDGSSTYLLIRKRPFHSIVDGASVYEPGYSIRKDVDQDVDYDGKLDLGFEIPTSGTSDPVRVIDPIQIIDGFAWSNAGGKEYVRSSEQEISNTDGFNPDAASRLAYYGENPMLGQRLNSDMEVVPTRTADESFIYGDLTGASVDFTYDETRYGAPTDQSGDGFTDISITEGGDNFKLTPGTFNDHAATGIIQFRFVTGDLNFDGVVDAADLALFDSTFAGADFDATEDFIDEDTGMPIPDANNPGSNYQSYVFQDRLANGYLAALGLDPIDGETTPSASDRAVLANLVGPTMCNGADLNSDGVLDFFDISGFLTAFGSMDPIADFNSDGAFDFFDISAFLSVYAQGCP